MGVASKNLPMKSDFSQMRLDLIVNEFKHIGFIRLIGLLNALNVMVLNQIILYKNKRLEDFEQGISNMKQKD